MKSWELFLCLVAAAVISYFLIRKIGKWFDKQDEQEALKEAPQPKKITGFGPLPEAS